MWASFKSHLPHQGVDFRYPASIICAARRTSANSASAKPDADDPRQCEIGFTLAPEHQGRGYATEAARLLIGYLFTTRGKHRITAYCDARNTASAAVLERLGMRREGHLRESTWAKGEWTDDLVYGLLHDEWHPGGAGAARIG